MGAPQWERHPSGGRDRQVRHAGEADVDAAADPGEARDPNELIDDDEREQRHLDVIARRGLVDGERPRRAGVRGRRGGEPLKRGEARGSHLRTVTPSAYSCTISGIEISGIERYRVLRRRGARAILPRTMTGNIRSDDPDGLRQFKAEFFKALAHPLRIRILELLRQSPMSVGQLQEAIGVPASSISQHLAILRSQRIVATERRGTTVILRVRDVELFDLLDVARRLFNTNLEDAIDLLRLVDAEPVGATRVTG